MATSSIYEGTFDTTALQHELAQALEEDRRYKRTDEMKKRAIHTAASYDEFRVRRCDTFWYFDGQDSV
jgi:hypothetical protein